jgi:hypothetical protein
VATLPLIIAGPIVRRVETRFCSIWIALRDPVTVTANVWLGEQFAGATSPLATGTAQTRPFGDHLHVAVVTVELPFGMLVGKLYSYDLNFGDKSLRSEGLLTKTAPSDVNPGREPLGYLPNRLPSFVTPAAPLPELKIAHGSCRKTSGPGFDALAWLDDFIGENFNKPDRPQQLFLTGDQIYADDVASCLLPAINSLAKQLVGTTEKVPISNDLTLDSTIQNFPPVRRQRLVRGNGGFTSGEAHSHLISYGEYAAMYCLAWSPGVWLEKLSSMEELFVAFSGDARLKSLLTEWEKCKEKELKEFKEIFEEEIERAKIFRSAVPKAARALANTVTYMIMDDHEITDDWNLTQGWRNRVYTKPLGRAIVRNAMLAYTVFQAWGNEPEKFKTVGNNKDLLDKTSEIAAAHNNASIPSLQRLEELIGISGAEQSKQAQFHYNVPGPKHLAVVMDSRTRRKFSGQNDLPPDLLGDSLDAQVPKGPFTDGRELLLLIAPAPVLGTTLLDKIGQPVAQSVIDIRTGAKIQFDRAENPCKPGRPVWGFQHYDAEGWAANEEAQQKLLLRLAEYPRTVILSGDVHYGLSMEMDFWRKGVTKPSRIVQLTSSPLRNDFKPIVQALVRSNALLQDFQRGLETELLAWKDAPAPITIPAGARIGLGRRARMLRSPALLSTRGWPKETSVPDNKLPDWSWRLKLVRDQRPNGGLPKPIQQPKLDPDQDLNTGDPLPGYQAVARRQALVAATHFDHLRQLVFNTHFGFVSFSGSDDTLKVTHTLFSRTGVTNENKGAANTVQEILLVTAASEQPPKIK